MEGFMEMKRTLAMTLSSVAAATVVGLFVFQSETAYSIDPPAAEPGGGGGAAGAGDPLPGLNATQTAFFELGKEDFNEAEEADEGLGPRMNLDGCGGCHSQPAIGGTSPAVNPQVAFANAASPSQLPAVAQ